MCVLCLLEEGELAISLILELLPSTTSLSIQPILTQHLLSTCCSQASENEVVEGLSLPSSEVSAFWPRSAYHLGDRMLFLSHPPGAGGCSGEVGFGLPNWVLGGESALSWCLGTAVSCYVILGLFITLSGPQSSICILPIP